MEQIRAEFDHLVDQMEWVDVISTLQNMLNSMGDTSNALPVLPPPEPIGQGFSAVSQLVGGQSGGYDGFIPPGATFGIPNPMMAAPSMYHQPLHHPMAPPNAFNQAQFVNQPFDMNSQVGPFNPNQSNNASVWMPADGSHPKSVEDFAKRKIGEHQDFERPYVKRPPNAFVLFMKEQRPKVVAELKNRNNSAVNTILGQRWRSLSPEEQAPYYEQAKMERLLHAQKYPQWSIKENYGKKRKRMRCKNAPNVIVTSAQTGVMEGQSGPTAVPEPECDTSHLVQRPEVIPTWQPDPQAEVVSVTTLPSPMEIQPLALESTQLHCAEAQVPPVLENAPLPPSGEDVKDPECPLEPQRAATPPAPPAPVQTQPPSSEFNVSLSLGDDLLLMLDDAFWVPTVPAQPAGGAVAQLMEDTPCPPQVPEDVPVSPSEPETTARTATASPPHRTPSQPGQELCVEGGRDADAGQ